MRLRIKYKKQFNHNIRKSKEMFFFNKIKISINEKYSVVNKWVVNWKKKDNKREKGKKNEGIFFLI